MRKRQYLGQRNLIGGNLRKIRKAKNVSQKELAAKMQLMNIGIDQQVISRIENDKRIVYDYELIGICKVLGISIDELAGDIMREIKEKYRHLLNE